MWTTEEPRGRERDLKERRTGTRDTDITLSKVFLVVTEVCLFQCRRRERSRKKKTDTVNFDDWKEDPFKRREPKPERYTKSERRSERLVRKGNGTKTVQRGRGECT